ncbi:leucyl aminopeptidase [Atopobacter phocae]|uniref:leucyl aminopeptidase n=1 Tax=Atopobacter phocae TaxID=136492 RepID=UPI000471D5B3|nr:leucyl aminopeptidase [Atopobacter phocae]
MEFILKQKIELNKSLLLFVEEGTVLTNFLENDVARYFSETRKFTGEAGSISELYAPDAQQYILVGVGKGDHLKADDITFYAFKAAQHINQAKLDQVAIQIQPLGHVKEEEVFERVVEGFSHFSYQFNTYLTKKKELNLKEVDLITSISDSESRLEQINHIIDGMFWTRDLVNQPANVLYPESYANEIVEKFSDLPINVKVYAADELKELNLKGLLAVGQGSKRDPRFVVMKYMPEGENLPAITLVGKGVTYDSGGYAIKPATGMVDMKSDMGGSAGVVGTLYALASNNIQKNVIGIVGLAENMIDGQAYKNGDIISTMKGTTIEVHNTDAEGRITLADSLYYAATKENSELIIDLATLTGASLVALGERTIGSTTNNRPLFEEIKEAGQSVGETLWEMPMTEDLRDTVKGTVGDLKNTGGRFGGMITAGIFLEHFVEGKPWVHLDIAGPAFGSSAYRYLPKDATGVPVRTLYRFIKERSKK